MRTGDSLEEGREFIGSFFLLAFLEYCLFGFGFVGLYREWSRLWGVVFVGNGDGSDRVGREVGRVF